MKQINDYPCKKLLQKLKLKGYLVTEGALKPINHRDIIKITDMNNQIIVIKLEDVINRISPYTKQ